MRSMVLISWQFTLVSSSQDANLRAVLPKLFQGLENRNICVVAINSLTMRTKILARQNYLSGFFYPTHYLEFILLSIAGVVAPLTALFAYTGGFILSSPLFIPMYSSSKDRKRTTAWIQTRTASKVTLIVEQGMLEADLSLISWDYLIASGPILVPPNVRVVRPCIGTSNRLREPMLETLIVWPARY